MQWTGDKFPAAFINFEKLLDSLEHFGFKYASEQKLFKNLASCDFQEVCVQEEIFKDTNTSIWTEKHVPISLPLSKNIVNGPISLCNSNPHHLVASLIGSLESSVSESKTQMKLLFPETKTKIKNKMAGILQKVNQFQKRREQASLHDCDNECCTTTQFSQKQQKQKNQLFELQQKFERFCNLIPVFGFNRAQFDLIVVKFYSLPFLVNELDIATTVIKKANQFNSFKSSDNQLLDKMNSVVGATYLDSFWRHTKLHKQK